MHWAQAGQDLRPQHYVEISKSGDTWLFSKEGDLFANATVCRCGGCMCLMWFDLLIVQVSGTVSNWYCHDLVA